MCATWPLFSRALLLSKLLNQTPDADVLHVLLELLMNLSTKEKKKITHTHLSRYHKIRAKTHTLKQSSAKRSPVPLGRACPLWTASKTWSAASSSVSGPPRCPGTSAWHRDVEDLKRTWTECNDTSPHVKPVKRSAESRSATDDPSSANPRFR